MTNLETLLRQTFDSRAEQAPSEHRVVAESLRGTASRTSRRGRRFAGAVAAIGIAATVVVGVSIAQGGGTPRAVDRSTGPVSQTTETATPTQDPAPTPAPSPDYSDPTQALNEYSNAVTELIVQCLQTKGFPVVMNKNSQMSDGDGRKQLTWRTPPTLQEDPDYRAAGETCRDAAEAAVPPPPA